MAKRRNKIMFIIWPKEGIKVLYEFYKKFFIYNNNMDKRYFTMNFVIYRHGDLQ